MYEELIRPIHNLGGADPVTAADLRNCLSVVAQKLESAVPPATHLADDTPTENDDTEGDDPTNSD